MPNKYIGLGCVVQVDPAGSTSYSTIDQVLNFTPPGRERALIDVTALDSAIESNMPGILKARTFEFTIIWDPDDTVHAALNTLVTSKATAQWKLTYTDATPATQTFKGFVYDMKTEQVEHNKLLLRKFFVSCTTDDTMG